MTIRTKIAAAVHEADLGNLRREAARLERARVDYLHFDIMDGVFVTGITFGAAVLSALKGQTKVPMDVHMMVEEPARFIETFVDAGASSVAVHVEACRHLHRSLVAIRQVGARPGVAANPATPLSALEYALEDASFVILMLADPGPGGETMATATLKKVEALREMVEARGLETEIWAEGGISSVSAPVVVSAGADVLVAGRAGLFESGMPLGRSVRTLRGGDT